MTWSFSPGPLVAVTWSAFGFSGSASEDAIRRPACSGICVVDVTDLTTSAAASVSTSMGSPLTSRLTEATEASRQDHKLITPVVSRRGAGDHRPPLNPPSKHGTPKATLVLVSKLRHNGHLDRQKRCNLPKQV